MPRVKLNMMWMARVECQINLL